MKIIFIVLVLGLGFLTTPINGMRPLTSPSAPPTPNLCSPTSPSSEAEGKKLGSVTFGWFLIFFPVLSGRYLGYCMFQAGMYLEGEEIVVREEVVNLTSPEVKLVNLVQSARTAFYNANSELKQVYGKVRDRRGAAGRCARRRRKRYDNG